VVLTEFIDFGKCEASDDCWFIASIKSLIGLRKEQHLVKTTFASRNQKDIAFL